MENRLGSFRERRGLSQDDLARQLRVSKQTIASIEKGKYDPSLPLAKEIARFFRVAVEDVFPSPVEEAELVRATFVMTDIEKSTDLASTLGESYVDVLRRHRDLLIEAFTGHRGRIV